MNDTKSETPKVEVPKCGKCQTTLALKNGQVYCPKCDANYEIQGNG